MTEQRFEKSFSDYLLELEESKHLDFNFNYILCLVTKDKGLSKKQFEIFKDKIIAFGYKYYTKRKNKYYFSIDEYYSYCMDKIDYSPYKSHNEDILALCINNSDRGYD